MGRRWARLLSLLLALLLGIEAGAVRAAPAPQSYTFRECQSVDLASLHTEIETLTRQALAGEEAALDVAALVDRQWSALGMDAVVDEEVTVAVERLLRTESYWNRFLSGWSAERANVFATRIAADAFGSERFRSEIEVLSAAVAAEIAGEIEAMSARSASSALLCLQEYVGERYSQTLFDLFQQTIDIELAAIELAPEGEFHASIVDGHGAALGGLGLIVATQVVRRISAKLGQRMAERVAGRVATRVLGRLGSSLIPVAGWVVGLGLIAWDLAEGSRGATPQIAEALQSAEVKVGLRREVTAAVNAALDAELETVASAIADSVIAEWQTFCAAHQHLCELPLRSEPFKLILDDTPVVQLPRLANLVEIYLGQLGQEALDAALDNGSFEALLALPEAALAILKATGSQETAQAWAEAAGPALDQVVELRLYEHLEPDELSAAGLDALLDLKDPVALERLVQLAPSELASVLGLPADDLAVLARRLRADDWRWLLTWAKTEERSLAALASDLVDGTVTLAQLQAPPTPTETPVVTATPSLPPAAEREPPNSVLLVASFSLLALLAAGALLAWWKRRRLQP